MLIESKTEDKAVNEAHPSTPDLVSVQVDENKTKMGSDIEAKGQSGVQTTNTQNTDISCNNSSAASSASEGNKNKDKKMTEEGGIRLEGFTSKVLGECSIFQSKVKQSFWSLVVLGFIFFIIGVVLFTSGNASDDNCLRLGSTGLLLIDLSLLFSLTTWLIKVTFTKPVPKKVDVKGEQQKRTELHSTSVISPLVSAVLKSELYVFFSSDCVDSFV